MAEHAHQNMDNASGAEPAHILNREQTSSEKNFRVYQDNWRLRLKRNLRILVYLANLYYRWLVFGGRIRRAWRLADKSGQPFVLEEILGMDK